MNLFIAEQVATVPDASVVKVIDNNTIIQQYNTSSIKLEMNVGKSSTKCTRHIHIIYFYITNKVKSGEVKFVYYPSKEMVLDYLTKPLHGLPSSSH